MLTVLRSNLANIVIFNILWLAFVVGRDNLLWLTGPLLIAYVGILLQAGKLGVGQLMLPVVVGIFVDCCLTLAGFYVFDDSFFIIPLWLMALWVAFSTTLSLSLSFLAINKWFAIAGGAIGFPFSYAVGERLGAVSFGYSSIEVLVTLAVIWAILLPLLFNGINRIPAAPAKYLGEGS